MITGQNPDPVGSMVLVNNTRVDNLNPQLLLLLYYSLSSLEWSDTKVYEP